eukprot:m.37412 g.37412  ORF g.37412 m.37412 type:complete len:447 (-) comp9807_c0_seq2:45-1385(-)
MSYKRTSLASDGQPSYAELAQTLSELKHTVSNKPQSAQVKSAPRRVQSRVDLVADHKDKIMLMVVDGKGRKMRMQLPMTSMARLQDFLEEKMKIMKSLQRIFYRDMELHPSDARPFSMHGVVEGEELLVREEPVSLTLRLPRERSMVFKDVLLSDTVGRLKWRIEEHTGIAYVQQRLRYLEDYDLGDDARLYDCGVVPGAIMHVHLWSDWADVYDFVRDGNSEGLLRRLAAEAAAAAAAPGSSSAQAAPAGRSSSAPASPAPHLAPPHASSLAPSAAHLALPGSPARTSTHTPASPARTQLSPLRASSVASGRPSVDPRGPRPALGEGAWAALYLAAFEGSVRLCKQLVAMGIDPGRGSAWRHSARGTGRTPIHAAAGRGHLKCLQELVSPRVAFCTMDLSGVTAEMWAKQNGHAACADLLAMARWDQRLARARVADQVKLPPVKG